MSQGLRWYGSTEPVNFERRVLEPVNFSKRNTEKSRKSYDTYIRTDGFKSNNVVLGEPTKNFEPITLKTKQSPCEQYLKKMHALYYYDYYIHTKSLP